MTVCQAGGHNLFESKQSSKPPLRPVIKWQQRCFGGWWRSYSLRGSELNSWKKSIAAEIQKTHKHSTIVYDSLIGWQKEQSDNKKMWLLQDCDLYVSLS